MNKPDSANGAFHALAEQRIIALSGRDALAFVQAQTMNDAGALVDGQWQWSGWLTPKGRVIALFALLRLHAESLWLLLPDADADEIASHLRRFLFRSRVAIDVRADLHVQGRFEAPAAASLATFAGDVDTRIELDLGGAGGPRTLRIAASAAADQPQAAVRWRHDDLAHGLPRLGPTQAGQWTPQQLSLERLRAYSVKKGCYPGQEIVARTHFLGQAKRGLTLLTGTSVASGAQVEQDGRAVGQVVSVAQGDAAIALAVLPAERAPSPLTIDGVECAEHPLLAGLAR